VLDSSCLQTDWLSIRVHRLYGLQTQPAESGAQECERACEEGREQQTYSRSLLPSRCGRQLVRLLECVNTTGGCGEYGWTFSCGEEIKEASDCGATCGAELKCDPSQCKGYVLSGAIMGDVACTVRCKTDDHCAYTMSDACYVQ
jgi:hypothetical protein